MHGVVMHGEIILLQLTQKQLYLCWFEGTLAPNPRISSVSLVQEAQSGSATSEGPRAS